MSTQEISMQMPQAAAASEAAQLAIGGLMNGRNLKTAFREQ